jgi:hypothetical protein
MAMRARFRMQCRAPHGLGDGEQITECELVEKVPFAPRVGDHLKVTSRGEFHEVGEVRWDIDAPAYLIVYFREPEGTPEALPWFPDLRNEGWTEL